MREINPELHNQRVSASLVGKFGSKSRRWLDVCKKCGKRRER
jgi:hypothetical protein